MWRPVSDTAQVGDLHAQIFQPLGKDWTIPADLPADRHNLYIGTQTSPLCQPIRIFPYRFDPGVRVAAGPLVHYMDHFIHKAVQTNHSSLHFSSPLLKFSIKYDTILSLVWHSCIICIIHSLSIISHLVCIFQFKIRMIQNAFFIIIFSVQIARYLYG
jgi:hypothetical protein